mgnify:CR=1 FL=1
MAMLDHVEQQKILTKSLLTVLLVGVLGLSLLLIATASRLTHTAGTLTGRVGPLTLFEVGKIPVVEGGYQGSFTFRPIGMLIYTGVLCSLGLLLAAARLHADQK